MTKATSSWLSCQSHLIASVNVNRVDRLRLASTFTIAKKPREEISHVEVHL
jgi:hypothetical protein